ncbi:threonine-phosphate decarboxylase CobD [Shewanella schlegeliana]|uniref:threonine-phosphate decarboxylase n=1 Tax=Shewanella schlegeliana TaxID=190308 RepID=A0ABS1SVQ4_9GAMM|nr:threonine-phosphate decarboxylase CobD [Shewanella schlegeliana]MBL4912110.1 threonine-phosphate decarboxylase [Shewanella schlegeliana]MCL1111292.1 threonine-phosphate decarboxylase CobD [Shewanella schlegeliana]GIU32892.1 threonine-phosphate decarboxylase [Shewanella schlegeliana]
MSGIEKMALLHHGGRLRIAISQFGGNENDWLDLSTGVSPWHFPVPELPTSCWNRLPEEDDGLIPAADGYYGGHNALPVAGSQAAIQCLPNVLAKRRGSAGVVLLPRVGYKEHERAWCMQGWQIEYYGTDSIGDEHNSAASMANVYEADVYKKGVYKKDNFQQPSTQQLARCDVLLVINPNNPAAHLIPRATLHAWLVELSAKGSVLVVDEAFMDMTPDQSLLPITENNLIVLRSIGKFFGLAGIRAGFVYAPKDIRESLQTQLGPWCLNGPARQICKLALADMDWQQAQLTRLHTASQRLKRLLSTLPGAIVGSALFQTIYLANAPVWYERLCRHHILTRLTDEQDALRFGLPANELQWEKLTHALQTLIFSNMAGESRDQDDRSHD